MTKTMTKKLFAAAIAVVTLTAGSLALTADASARGGHGGGHGGRGGHMHGHNGHRGHYGHNGHRYRYGYHGRYYRHYGRYGSDRCWYWTRRGWVNYCVAADDD